MPPTGPAPVLAPSRLTLARQRRALTMAGLGEETGISSRVLAAWEDGAAQPAPADTVRLAAALRFPASFLTAPGIGRIPAGAASFRAPWKMTVPDRDAALAAARLAVCLDDWTVDRFRLPDPAVPDLPGIDPEACAETVRSRWGLGQSPASDMLALLEARGVRVFTLAADCAAADTFSAIWKGTPYVFLAQGKSPGRTRLDLATELGHLVMHSGSGPPAGPGAAREAARFAAAFLMPRAGILAACGRSPDAHQILRARLRWKVPALTLATRLRDLDLLDEHEYHAGCGNLSRPVYRAATPGSIPRETSQVWAKVFTALRAEGITPAAVARDLHLTPAELAAHIMGLVPVAVAGNAAKTRPARPDLRLITT